MTARLTPPSQSEMQQLAQERFGATTPRRRRLPGIPPFRDRFYRYVIKRADPGQWSKDIEEWLEEVERRTRIAIDRSGGLRTHRDLEARRLLGGMALAILEEVTGLLQIIPNTVAELFQSTAEPALALERIRAASDRLAALQRELEILALSSGPLDMPFLSPLAPSVNELIAFAESLIGQFDTMLVALRERDAIGYMKAGTHLADIVGSLTGLAGDVMAAGKASAGLAAAGTEASALAARETFAAVYQDLRRAGRLPAGGFDAVFPEPGRYPTLEIRPNGDVLGSYSDVRRYVRESSLSAGRRVGDSSIEAHHLLEEHLMDQFGIPANAGRSVALEWEDHRIFTEEVPRWLPRDKRFYDVDEIFDAHAHVYQSHGHPEWIPEMRDFLRQNREQLRARYEDGRVPGASAPDFPQRKSRVLEFLDDL
jgi:hypothetical protein